ncbi:hypothetical protein DIU31_009660 [Mucilaginibacter rubeus]|uniref:Uncharacterized protein n=2 Tax=Mucilaginibacter rubeus TaxID=2027860 RepID=A0AAE6JDL7_9SPHI|nr:MULTISPECIES: hypothetical protein [Mucilaginibacter]QEM03764.1 hypothetical protein DIU31_009660 [Mucilaginibacter rubeus]QEM16376.1 hypothetical protein DIU38_009760 [Mucilaginibacter gossypii]QTE40857.1 hypothetical protein J3L19_18000 [Mucilaginibacter rubeus]QTE47460.1 hypothetical protein J3L21_17975 [Mucilaginibacter rubeus]QTE61689.1 hypothetical protein J3L22_24215 [Mucilaginibacter rubeus]
MSTLIDKKAGTMSTLYANDIAMRAARSSRLRGARGLAMALVTWKQQENPYWYGNNIPGELLSVEMLSSDNRTDSIRYTLFERKKLAFNGLSAQPNQRKNFILDQKPSIMP